MAKAQFKGYAQRKGCPVNVMNNAPERIQEGRRQSEGLRAQAMLSSLTARL